MAAPSTNVAYVPCRGLQGGMGFFCSAPFGFNSEIPEIVAQVCPLFGTSCHYCAARARLIRLRHFDPALLRCKAAVLLWWCPAPENSSRERCKEFCMILFAHESRL